MSISAKELANILQVSPATVSMVFNNKPGISDATREMILNAAQKYGYSGKKSIKAAPISGCIRLLNYKKHGKVAADTPFFAQLTEGITQECSRQNIALRVSYFDETLNSSLKLSSLLEADCLGVLILGTEMSAKDFQIFKNFPIPIVVLDCCYDSPDYDWITMNNTQGAFSATSYLIACGHRSIGYLHSGVATGNFVERADGFYKALREHGFDAGNVIVHKVAPTSVDGYRDVKALLASGEKLAEAYFADNDIIAAAAMKAFREQGLRMPEDISIIGFDDLPLCDMMVPALSTMRVRKQELGAAAIQRLMARIAHPELKCLKMCMATELVVRDSVRVVR